MNTILVIEDEAPLLEEVLDVLSFENFNAIGAKNGLVGLQMAREHIPDLILCDVMMPEMDGYEVIHDLRNDLSTLAIPFIFLTAKADKTSRRKGMDLGADDYLTKPFTDVELLRAIRTRLAKQAAIETQRLRAYAHKLVKLQENERRQIAQILRNDLGQLAAGIQLTLDIGVRLPQESLKVSLHEARELATKVVTMLNDTAQELWPSVLDHLGLLPALMWHLDHYTGKTGLSVDFRHTGLDRAFSPAIKVGVYYLIQEALNNVVDHAEANKIVVQVWVEEQFLHAQISNEGTGFDLDQGLASETSVGFISMRERILSLNGEFSVVTAPDQGIRVLFKIPLEAAEESLPTDTHPLSEIRVGPTSQETPISPVIPMPPPNDHQPSAHKASAYAGATITVMMAYENEIMRRGLIGSLEDERDIAVIAEVAHGTGFLAAVEQTKPKVIIVELTLPGIDVLNVTQKITQQNTETHIMILSSYREQVYFLEAFRAGALGYVLDGATTNEVVQAIREVSRGRRYLSSALSERALESYIDIQRLQKDATLDTYGTLTNREREVMQLVLDGHTNAEVAEQLVISPRTAETHRANMMRKLGLRNYKELLRYALRRGIITEER